MKRTVIKINESLCNGCGACVTGCHEGALQMIDGKAVLISDLYCDGLGACIGECPVGAIEFEEREAAPYDEQAVMERLAPKGEKAVRAHLTHLKEHGEQALYEQGIEYLHNHNLDYIESDSKPTPTLACGCPGSTARSFTPVAGKVQPPSFGALPSALTHFPIKMHLINPNAPFIQGADLLFAADCTAFAAGNFHAQYLRGKVVAIGCPKLDSRTEVYVDKLVEMIDTARINTLTVAIMEVPCCGGLLRIAQTAKERAERNIPIRSIVITVEGDLKSDTWI